MLRADTIILGGGLSGLTLLKELSGDAILITKNVGGLIQNYVTPNGFSFDLGGHVYNSSNPDIEEVMNVIPNTLHSHRKSWWIRSGTFNESEKYTFPVQSSMRSLVTDTPQDTSWSPNLEDYSIKIFGEAFTEEFFRPFNERVWTTALSDLDVDWVKGRVQHPREFSDKNWGLNSSFYYAPGSEIVKYFLKDFSNNIINGTVLSVNLGDKTVRYQDDLSGVIYYVKYNRLIDTTGRFLEGESILRRNYIAYFGVGVEGSPAYDFHWCYGPFDQSVHRVTLLSSYHPGLAPSGTHSYLMEIPFSSEYRSPWIISVLLRAMKTKPNSSILKFAASAALRTAGFPIEKEKVIDVWAKVSLGYPVPMVGSRKVVAQIKEKLFNQNVFLAGRWGAHGYWNWEHIVTDARVVRRLLNDYSQDNLNHYLTSDFYYKV